jgi:hypothetical protein
LVQQISKEEERTENLKRIDVFVAKRIAEWKTGLWDGLGWAGPFFD